MGTEPLVCGGFSRQGWRTGCYIFSRFTSVRSCFIYSAIISQCPKPQLLFCCRVLFEIHAQSRAPGACQYRQPHALLPLPWSCFVCLLMLSFISNLISITIKTCLAFTLLHVQLITTNCKGIKHVFYRNIFPHFKGEKKEDRKEILKKWAISATNSSVHVSLKYIVPLRLGDYKVQTIPGFS